jgi:hypothetical protein
MKAMALQQSRGWKGCRREGIRREGKKKRRETRS